MQQGDSESATEPAKNSFSAKVKVKMQEKTVNATMDTGAGPSVIVGSLEHLGLADSVRKPDGGLVNASGDAMDVIGVRSKLRSKFQICVVSCTSSKS